MNALQMTGLMAAGITTQMYIRAMTENITQYAWHIVTARWKWSRSVGMKCSERTVQQMIRSNGDKVNVSVIMTKEIKEFAAEEAEKMGLNLSSYIRMLLIREKQKKEA